MKFVDGHKGLMTRQPRILTHELITLARKKFGFAFTQAPSPSQMPGRRIERAAAGAIYDPVEIPISPVQTSPVQPTFEDESGPDKSGRPSSRSCGDVNKLPAAARQFSSQCATKLAPLSAVVGVKGRRLRVALVVPRHLRADQFQTLAIVISHPEPLQNEFLFELLPTHLDLIPLHERLLRHG